jgi:hypothetical protein
MFRGIVKYLYVYPLNPEKFTSIWKPLDTGIVFLHVVSDYKFENKQYESLTLSKGWDGPYLSSLESSNLWTEKSKTEGRFILLCEKAMKGLLQLSFYTVHLGL